VSADIRRLPAEWEPQAGVMLTWPHPATDWADALDRVLPVFGRIGAAVSHREDLLSVCASSTALVRARAALAEAGADMARCRFARAPSNDSWARDHGPIVTLEADGPVLNDFRFNAWGGKFEAGLDDAIPRRLAEAGVFSGASRVARDLVLEGGALETDGQGTLLAPRRSVIDPERNPGLTAAGIETLLCDWLGIERFLWLDHGAVSGDDTDSHIDTLVRFADPGTLLYVTAPPGDPDAPGLDTMRDELHSLRTADGGPYRLLPLPFAGIHHGSDGRRLPATYANFLVVNGAVLMPAYGVGADTVAASVLGEAFPGREVVAIDCRPIITQNGSLHCLTMQFPAAVQLNDGPWDALAPSGDPTG
jgi:agmatine/peptidylarginine deiminase